MKTPEFNSAGGPPSENGGKESFTAAGPAGKQPEIKRVESTGRGGPDNRPVPVVVRSFDLQKATPPQHLARDGEEGDQREPSEPTGGRRRPTEAEYKRALSSRHAGVTQSVNRINENIGEPGDGGETYSEWTETREKDGEQVPTGEFELLTEKNDSGDVERVVLFRSRTVEDEDGTKQFERTGWVMQPDGEVVTYELRVPESDNIGQPDLPAPTPREPIDEERPAPITMTPASEAVMDFDDMVMAGNPEEGTIDTDLAGDFTTILRMKVVEQGPGGIPQQQPPKE